MKRRLFLVLLIVGLVPVDLFAQTPEERGLAIAMETDRRDAGFGNSLADITMILRNRQGDKSIRAFRMKILEVPGDGNKSMNIFDKPLDVKGTVILTFSHALKPDEQWIYLPALKRVKRISSSNKSGPFMGSEFAYEDIGSWEVKKYTYRYLRDDEVDGHGCFVVENTPAYQYSGYTRQIEWVDKTIHQPRQIVYYDRKNALLKTLTLRGYRQYLRRYWRPNEMLMVNHQTGKSTRLLWKNYRFRTGLSSRDFTKNSMKRAR